MKAGFPISIEVSGLISSNQSEECLKHEFDIPTEICPDSSSINISIIANPNGNIAHVSIYTYT